ncbi:hypothetical protein K438DRAFT_1723231 [Mycena galopus ATCC 62051]|nr:hypothetical protein K438DRAFT_1723231 [Mycena galopus ATCC 62051]
MSDISNDDLDMLLLHLRTHYQWAGLCMLNGMLRQLSHHIAIKRICQSLLRVDPVQRIFERICIRRRDYHVLGPNSLWHHDGQHGLICWGIECCKCVWCPIPDARGPWCRKSICRCLDGKPL